MDARVGDEDDDRVDVGVCLVDAFVEKHFFAHTIGIGRRLQVLHLETGTLLPRNEVKS
jgi:hypothetical protein